MIRNLAQAIIPKPLWKKLGILRRKWLSRHNHHLSTQEVFSRIYEHGIWGKQEGFDSGSGSEHEAVDPYYEAILDWAKHHGSEKLVAVDLGCGDFRVGSRVFPLFREYHALDIVPALIEHHRAQYSDHRLHFECVNAIEENLPAGDVIFVRQVLQHLSNSQILRILPKLSNFKHLILTEHIPHPDRQGEWNLDKVQGGDIRLSQHSGIDLELTPFHFTSIESRILLRVPGGDDPIHDGFIQTTYYRLQS